MIQIDQLSARASFLKTRMINHLEKYLIEFESQFTQRKGLVAFISDPDDAQQVIHSFVSEGSQVVLDFESDVLKEISIPGLLAKMPLESKDLKKIKELNFASDSEDLPILLAFWVPDMIVSESGSIIIQSHLEEFKYLEQRGFRFIFVCGIEQMLASDDDIELFMFLRSQNSPSVLPDYYVYSTPTTYPDMILMLDNGRSDILEHLNIRPILNCIQCGRCNTACPLKYFSIFQGPQKMIINSFLKNKQNPEGLFFSTLCAQCSKNCPMNIPIHEIILHSRTHFRNHHSDIFPLGTMLNIEKQESGGGLLKGITRKFFANVLFKGESADYFQSFELPEKSYIKQMVEEMKKKSK